MELTYYPGCTLHGTSEEYDQSIRAVCNALGIGLSELNDWTCCGASSAHAISDELADLLAARNLLLAEKTGRDVLVPCAACYSRLKFGEKSPSLNKLRKEMDVSPGKGIDILHIHDLLAQPEFLESLRKKIERPLTGLKTIPYYGCLTVRPPKVVDANSPENPVALDRILQTLGADVVKWSFKTDCCGGSFSLSRPEVVRTLSGDLMVAAKHAGADCFVTDCPMCQANLDSRQKEIEQERKTRFGMPIFFITELIALSLRDINANRWFKKHLVDPHPVLQKRGLSS